MSVTDSTNRTRVIQQAAIEMEYVADQPPGHKELHQRIGMFLGPAVFFVFFFTTPPDSLDVTAWQTAGICIWMATWWATEAIPVPITALLPIGVLPILDIRPIGDVAEAYASPVVYLLLGGFIVALGLQRWNLHQRIALTVVAWFGDRPKALVGGFMAATAILSMWVSNTASTLMMLPIAVSVAAIIAESTDGHSSAAKKFRLALILAIPYAASIGGLGTMIGSPPNLLVVGYLDEVHGIEISFLDWMRFGLPFVLITLPVVWFALTRLVFRFSLPRNPQAASMIRKSLSELGRLSRPERRMALVFSVIALAWMFRSALQSHLGLPGLSDAGIAVAGALAVFLVPSGAGGSLMNWRTAKTLPWDVLLLYGGGMALSYAVSDTGLAAWLGELISSLDPGSVVLLILVVAAMVLLTELMNNSAAVATFLPIIGVLALSSGLQPTQLAIPAALAASCAFMFPVATPPNAIVYGTGVVSLPQMVRAGVWLNLACIVLITTGSATLLVEILT